MAGLCLIGLAGWPFWVHHSAAESEIRLSCSAGGQATRRQKLASTLAECAAREALDIRLEDAAGTEECLQRVNSGSLDIALVAGGMQAERFPHVRQIAAIGVEPLHLLIKSELVPPSGANLALLKGKRVNLGHPDTTGYAISQELLAFAGLKAVDESGQGDCQLLTLSSDELINRARAIARTDVRRAQAMIDDLPDAVFVNNPLPSVVVQELLRVADYELVPLPYLASFQIHGVTQHGPHTRHVDRQQVTRVVIPAFTYGVMRPMPASDCETLGMRLLVVARHDLPDEAARRLAGTVYEGRLSHLLPPEDLLHGGFEYPLHGAVATFLQRRQPLVVKDMVEMSQKVFSLFGAFSAGVLTLYGIFRQRNNRHPQQLLAEISQVEHEAGQLDPQAAPESRLASVAELQGRLTQLKRQAVADFAAGRFVNDTALANILMLITDTRRALERLASTASATKIGPTLVRRRVDGTTPETRPPHDPSRRAA